MADVKKAFKYNVDDTSVVIYYPGDAVALNLRYETDEDILSIEDSFVNLVKYKKCKGMVLVRRFLSIMLSLVMSLCFPGCKPRSTDDIDGGVVTRNSGEDSPKVIYSTEIISFDCEFSFVSAFFEEENELAGKVYKMSAVLEDNTVKGKVDWYYRAGNGDKFEFETDSSFMTNLQEIVSKYNLAKHNGYYHHVSGLPNMYGENIDIKYASEESIYAHDNQDGFLPMDAMEELIGLFSSYKYE